MIQKFPLNFRSYKSFGISILLKLHLEMLDDILHPCLYLLLWFTSRLSKIILGVFNVDTVSLAN